MLVLSDFAALAALRSTAFVEAFADELAGGAGQALDLSGRGAVGGGVGRALFGLGAGDESGGAGGDDAEDGGGALEVADHGESLSGYMG
mgnify:CR=1 FL=1